MMKIESFVFKVSDNNIEDYNMVQKVLFENGYSWLDNRQEIISFNHTHDCVSFHNFGDNTWCDRKLTFSYISSYDRNDDNDNIFYRINQNDKKLYYDFLTFKEFMSRYSLKAQRKKKLERLYLINSEK